MDIALHQSRPLSGTFVVPGDKSISHRALMIAAISNGASVIRGLSSAMDVKSTQECLTQLGVAMHWQRDALVIEGRGRELQKPASVLDAGNSGTTIRLLTGILAGQKFDSSITGDESLRKRPMKRIIDPLMEMGAVVRATGEFTPPLQVYGGRQLRGIRFAPSIPSAQVKSSVLLASLFADGPTEIVETVQTRDHTERMLGLHTRMVDGSSIVRIEGRALRLEGRTFHIPGDISSAAFLIVAAILVQGSAIRIRNVGLNPTRTAFLDVLTSAGASIHVEPHGEIHGEPVGDIVAESSELHERIHISPELVPHVIDEIPILAIAGLRSSGGFAVRGARELRVKESDRLAALIHNLRSLGCDVEEYDDGFAFQHASLHGGVVESFGDHRIAMAFAIAGLVCPREVVVRNAESVAISFPDFWQCLMPFQK